MSALALSAPLMLVACATVGPPQPPSLDLPKPPSDLRATRKGDRVILTWTIPTLTTDRLTVRSLGPTHICRGTSDLKECGAPVGQTATQITPAVAKSAKQKPQGTYTDVIPSQAESDAPSSLVSYAVEVLNPDGRSAGLSNLVKVPLAHTLPPPADLQAHVTSQGVVLSWTGVSLPTPSQPRVHYIYRLYRHAEGSNEPLLVGEVAAAPENSFTLTDANIEWEKTYEYRVETVTLIDEANRPQVQVEGADSPEVKVFADDVFPPAVPSALQAVFSGPGQQPFIDLVWAPVSDVDLAGYNIYRHEEGATPLKLNTELVKTPAYRDANVVSGKKYVYSVSAVDIRGNESARSEEAGEAVP
ncbi:MAG TPA: hypothetical protein VE377_26405 [Candidatus Dormibacteraeota bacterium]|nr:hypothetical protein [Candidatus Dormibacteraeota bacterium]